MPRHMRRRPRPWSFILLTVVLLAGLYFSATHASAWISKSFKAPHVTRVTQAQPPKPTKPVNQVQLNVPLVNQEDAPSLYNGCEVTALTMLLNYAHINVTKNQLAAKLPTVPLNYANGDYGDPNSGFVGDITGANPGLGVYHGPIARLAARYTNRVHDLTGSSFNTVIDQLELGRPVWTITTTSFAPVSSMQTWQTPHGNVQVTYDMHSVVITGFNRAKKIIYLNNPYGTKQQAVNWNDFEGAYNQMGKQAIDLQ